jgi:hypothetical protein
MQIRLRVGGERREMEEKREGSSEGAVCESRMGRKGESETAQTKRGGEERGSEFTMIGSATTMNVVTKASVRLKLARGWNSDREMTFFTVRGGSSAEAEERSVGRRRLRSRS